ncbi:virulence RhuM family protein [Acidithiobacillus ferriphilus]|jgi:Virulence protein|nr:virulence RhuM family protein [Acidithiobacillus ferriphilus]MBU2849282.1 virulence RhuM family protein [Acidithiobacillus ferriphilus]
MTIMTEPQQFLIYQSEDGSTRIDVMLEAETLWLNQKQLTELFGKAKGTISEHIKHIFEDGELDEHSVVRLFRTTAADGKQYVVAHYNLDMILALGFRVRSPVGVRFRQWANEKLKEYIVKGFVLDDARLKNPGKGRDYFDELTRRLQDIRTSERRFYQKITDIYATSVDYDARHPLTQQFFATVQNKVHYAIHGQTAAELITSRADSRLPNMGLTTWEGARIRKSDVGVAKNYLSEEELRALNNLAEQYLIFAEGQAVRRIAMTMQDWITKLEGFLTLNDRAILQGAGQVSAELAKAHAEQEFDKFRVLDDQRFESDFDRMVRQLPTKKPKG